MRRAFCKVSELLGKTLESIVVRSSEKDYEDEILFACSDGTKYRMFHDQDCCESVTIEDICGDISDLIGTPLLMAEEVSNNMPEPELDYEPDSYTWTWYKFATVKGYVTVRWYGESNGYYSESVDFEKIEEE